MCFTNPICIFFIFWCRLTASFQNSLKNAQNWVQNDHKLSAGVEEVGAEKKGDETSWELGGRAPWLLGGYTPLHVTRCGRAGLHGPGEGCRLWMLFCLFPIGSACVQLRFDWVRFYITSASSWSVSALVGYILVCLLSGMPEGRFRPNGLSNKIRTGRIPIGKNS